MVPSQPQATSSEREEENRVMRMAACWLHDEAACSSWVSFFGLLSCLLPVEELLLLSP